MNHPWRIQVSYRINPNGTNHHWSFSENPPSLLDFPHKGTVVWSFHIIAASNRTSYWTYKRFANNLRRHDANVLRADSLYISDIYSAGINCCRIFCEKPVKLYSHHHSARMHPTWKYTTPVKLTFVMDNRELKIAYTTIGYRLKCTRFITLTS